MTLSKDKAQKLLELANFSSPILSITDCNNGGNNRTYRVQTKDQTFAVKHYFRHSEDKRDRLSSEFAFLTYAAHAAPHMTPLPYSKDDELGLALYEFIDGKSLHPDEISYSKIDEAIKFFCLLNDSTLRMQSADIPAASESCFTIEDHLSLVGARIKELQQVNIKSEEDKKALTFISKLSHYWESVKKRKINMNSNLNLSQRCISPSDFGFHNALRLSDGSIRFLDFEYAGWDDPAKMTGDFFSQLAVPIEAEFFDYFVKKTMNPFAETETLIKRAEFLRPVYQVKWCCIALNVFIPVHLARKKFSNPGLNEIELKKSRLKKAESLIHHLEYQHA